MRTVSEAVGIGGIALRFAAVIRRVARCRAYFSEGSRVRVFAERTFDASNLDLAKTHARPFAQSPCSVAPFHAEKLDRFTNIVRGRRRHHGNP